MIPALFAVTSKAVGNPQIALFAAFGGFATLVLTSFPGGRRDKLLAHLQLAVVGSVLLSIGTAVTSSTVAAALVTVPVTFAVFFAGVLGPVPAAGTLGAMLAYVLPAASPGTVSMIPDRLIGWWLASVFGTAAVLILSPRSGRDPLRAQTAATARGLSRLLDEALRGEGREQDLEAAVAAKRDLLALFSSTPIRPLGLGPSDQALANLVELLEWCTSLIVDALREHPDLRSARTEDRALLTQSAATLEDVAVLLEGNRLMPGLERLEQLARESRAAAGRLDPGEPGFRALAEISFHAEAIAAGVYATAADAAVAERLADPGWLRAQRRRYAEAGRSRVSAATAAAAHHASVRSVWFVNSLRAGIALGAAVAIADVSSVQHGFWVVLGTLSVLRTSAASTGSTALRALGGTAIGFVVGGALLVAIGSSEIALWAVLPVALFVSAYAPGTAPFAVGQAAFTVTVAVLFNLLAPVGWKVGILRIEDVAIGCAVSVLVGFAFWPRGVASVVGDDLADAYRAAAALLTEGVRWAVGANGTAPPDGAEAAATADRLDEALRAFLAEQGSKRIERQQLWRLVGGTIRLRLTALSVARLAPEPDGAPQARAALERRAAVLDSWYERLAQQLGNPRGMPVATLSPPVLGPDTVVDGSSSSRYTVWLCEHLDHLAEHLAELIAPARRVAELRREPWWR